MKCYTVKETASLLSIHWSTVYRLIKSGELNAIRVGRAVRIPEEALDSFMTPRAPDTKTEKHHRVITRIM